MFPQLSCMCTCINFTAAANLISIVTPTYLLPQQEKTEDSTYESRPEDIILSSVIIRTQTKEMDDGFKSLEDIIYPDIEPGVISKEMVSQVYLDSGGKGETARLHKLEPINFEKITVLRLEFKNILRINYLWIMPNLTKLSINYNKIEVIEHLEMLTALKELDLSFNFIEKIENLDRLVNLQILSLFNNLITKIENVDALENLIIISLGNNKIDTLDGIERFRFLSKLNVLNLEGNPIAKITNFCLSAYIAAILPNIIYYEYVYIKDEVRKEAKEKFYRELREVESMEEAEVEHRKKIQKQKFDAERLSSSFVEYLNEHQLYETFWDGDEEGKTLMLVGEQADELTEEYRSDVYEITQEIYKLGLEKFEEREVELKEFKRSIDDGQKAVQKSGQHIISEYLEFKNQIFADAKNVLTALTSRTIQGEDEHSPESEQLGEQFENISNFFNDRTNEIWQVLMSEELHLFESTEETTTNFQRKIQEMISKFVEQEQTFFGQLRDIAIHFSENLTEIVSQFISYKLATQQFEDVPEQLKICLEDKDAIMNLIAGMKDYHTQRIDEREDRLVTRTKNYIDDLMADLNKKELSRNRDKVLEINSFLEHMTQSLMVLQDEIHDEFLNERT